MIKVGYIAAFLFLVSHLTVFSHVLKTFQTGTEYSRLRVIRSSKGDKNLARITWSSNNFPPIFQLNFAVMDFSEVIEALWISIA